MFNSLLDAVSSSSWTYLVVFGLAALDVVFPVLPSETAVITAGVLAAAGDLSIALVVGLAAVGACLGDNTAYLIGRTLKDFVRTRLFHGSRGRHLNRAERTLSERGGYLIVVGRFIPGGRTAVTFASGILRYRWLRFVAFDAIAGVSWALYAGLIGYFGGKAFENHPLKGILLALGIAFGVATVVEGQRWYRRRALRRRLEARGPRLPEAAAENGADRG